MRILGLFLLAFLAACGARAQDVVARCKAAASPPECAREAARAHPIRKADFWKAALERPLMERIAAAPPELVEFLALDNVANAYPNEPRIAKVSPGFIADVKRALDEIPASVKRLIAPKLAGIYLADDIGGTGFTDEALDEAGKGTVAFMILDPTVLMERTANAWATWKEASPFMADSSWKLEARIENRSRDDRVHAIQYILLHELGHVLSVGTRVHPPWSIPMKDIGPAESYPFFALSWRVAGDRFASVHDAHFPQRADVSFYFGAKLGADAMAPVYAALEKTDFPTLYAATSPGDDFAEAFANFVHVELMGRPFEIRILRDGKLVKSYGPCWREPRCAAKKSFLERFLAGS